VANLVSHGHVRHFGWHVFAVVEYCHDATVETLDAATVLLQSHTHTHTHTHCRRAYYWTSLSLQRTRVRTKLD